LELGSNDEYASGGEESSSPLGVCVGFWLGARLRLRPNAKP